MSSVENFTNLPFKDRVNLFREQLVKLGNSLPAGSIQQQLTEYGEVVVSLLETKDDHEFETLKEKKRKFLDFLREDKNNPTLMQLNHLENSYLKQSNEQGKINES